ncbi:MAG: 4-alpha-glucanotransferase [Candidatus Limnocylindria bacterium]
MSSQLVDDAYTDAYDRQRRIAPDVRAAVLAALDKEAADDADGQQVAVARRGSRLRGPGSVTLEDGSSLGRVDVLPADVPFGYHHLHRDDGIRQLLITGPGRCQLTPELRAWGWAIQLAATRSRQSWGIGDLGDLRRLGAWSAGAGAGFLAVGPLGAPNPGPSPEPSPYYPSTRRFGNPLYLQVEEIPGAELCRDELAELAMAARAMNETRLIDRVRVAALKQRALERIWVEGADRSAFDAWRAERGQALERWATFVVLTERFGAGWQQWPEPYRDPDGAAVGRAAAEDADRVAFHAWIQWCFDRQLADASAPLLRIADMPVGVDPGGFDAWDWQGQLAMGASIGAPPDRFNAAGQDWGLPPFNPYRLREAAYRPFIETIHAQLRHAGGLRIDHVLGLFRLWWIPFGHDPTRGAYVRSQTDELLEIVALESHRAGAIVIGEDLGTVPAGVRAELRRRRLMSTRLALFERVPPSRYPAQSFAGVTTHDLPTIAGVWSGADLDDQASSGVTPDPDALAVLRSRLERAAGVESEASLDEVVLRLHERVAASPSSLVAGTLEDALRVEERPNMPGTVAPARRNWSLALPATIEELGELGEVRTVVEALRR